MADFWSGFTQGFTPTYLNTRSRRDRKLELERARQELLADRDTVRQQRLGDMATDRQQRLDDRDSERAYQARLTAAATKYREDRERRKIIAAIQSTDPSVSEQARDEAFFAQPREEQEAAAYRGEAREGFKEVSPLGVESSVRPEPSQMQGRVGYRDLGEEGTWGASARAARLQVTADAAKKIRADLAAEGNKYGYVRGEGETDAEFAQRVQVAKNEDEINLARKMATAKGGGELNVKLITRFENTERIMASIWGPEEARRIVLGEKDRYAIKDKDGNFVSDEIDEATGKPLWIVRLASPTVQDELGELDTKMEEYRGVFGRSPNLLEGDVNKRRAAIGRLQAEIDREKAEQEDDRKVALKKEMDALPKPVLAQLDKLRKAYHAEGADQQAILGNTALLLGSETGAFVAKDQAEAFLESGILAGGEVGAGVKPPTETAAERGQRRTFISVLTRLDALLDESDKHDWTGVIPSLNAIVKDEFLPVFGIDKYANFERASFRSTASVTAWNLVRSLNEEGRLSDKDAAYLFPLVPTVNDEKPEFRAKLSAIKSLVIDKLQLQAAGAGRTDAFSLDPVTLLKSVDQPSAEFGGVVQIPHKYAMSVIGNMPQYKFIGEDKTKPVTFGYIMGQPDLTDKQKRMWILGADIPLPRR
jgi:hypothetical protein